MFQRCTFKRISVEATGVLLLLALPESGVSQIESIETEEPAEAIEEIVVHGHKSLIDLKHEMYEAEEVVYGVFNSLNSDDDDDIHCYEEAPTGSKIKKRVCKTEKLGNILTEQTQKMMRDEPFVFPKAEINKMNEILLAEMNELAATHPEYLKAVQMYDQKKRTWESERERRCEGRVFICRRQ